MSQTHEQLSCHVRKEFAAYRVPWAAYISEGNYSYYIPTARRQVCVNPGLPPGLRKLWPRCLQTSPPQRAYQLTGHKVAERQCCAYGRIKMVAAAYGDHCVPLDRGLSSVRGGSLFEGLSGATPI